MSDLQVIQTTLERTARRTRWAAALRGLWAGMLIGGIGTLILLGAYKLFPLPVEVPAAAALLPIVGALAGAAVGFWRKPSLLHVARWVDHTARSQERLSTALEVSSQGEARWRDLVLHDAARCAERLDPSKLLPLRLGRSARFAAAALVLCAILTFVPEHRTQAYLRKQADVQNINETGRRISEFARRNVERRPPALESTRTALETAAELGASLEKRTLTRSDAMREIANAAEKIRQQSTELAKDPALKQMRQAARSSGGEMPSRESIQKQIDDLKAKLGSDATPEQLDKLKSQLAKAGAAAKALEASGGSQEEKQKLASQVAELGRQAEALGLQLPQLDSAIDALAAQQTDLFLKNLEASLADLEKLAAMAKTLQAMQQQADKLGKDLAEQLKLGQAETARETLSNLARQLQSTKLSSEQMKRILDEVSKAENPAQTYGKVAEHLQNARKQMQQGDSQAAAESLKAAAKELEDLMQQFGDAQAMM